MALNYRTTALVVESWEEARSRPEFEERVGALIFRQYVLSEYIQLVAASCDSLAF